MKFTAFPQLLHDCLAPLPFRVPAANQVRAYENTQVGAPPILEIAPLEHRRFGGQGPTTLQSANNRSSRGTRTMENVWTKEKCWTLQGSSLHHFQNSKNLVYSIIHLQDIISDLPENGFLDTGQGGNCPPRPTSTALPPAGRSTVRHYMGVWSGNGGKPWELRCAPSCTRHLPTRENKEGANALYAFSGWGFFGGC